MIIGITRRAKVQKYKAVGYTIVCQRAIPAAIEQQTFWVQSDLYDDAQVKRGSLSLLLSREEAERLVNDLSVSLLDSDPNWQNQQPKGG